MLFFTSFRSPVDGSEQPGPQITAANEAAAKQIARALSYDGQPVWVRGFMMVFDPGTLNRACLDAAVKVKAEVTAAIGAVPRERRKAKRRQLAQRWPATEEPPKARRKRERRT